MFAYTFLFESFEPEPISTKFKGSVSLLFFLLPIINWVFFGEFNWYHSDKYSDEEKKLLNENEKKFQTKSNFILNKIFYLIGIAGEGKAFPRMFKQNLINLKYILLGIGVIIFLSAFLALLVKGNFDINFAIFTEKFFNNLIFSNFSFYITLFKFYFLGILCRYFFDNDANNNFLYEYDEEGNKKN